MKQTLLVLSLALGFATSALAAKPKIAKDERKTCDAGVGLCDFGPI